MIFYYRYRLLGYDGLYKTRVRNTYSPSRGDFLLLIQNWQRYNRHSRYEEVPQSCVLKMFGSLFALGEHRDLPTSLKDK